VKTKLVQTCLLAAVVLFSANPYDVLAIVHYVGLNSSSPTPPYTSWATAATNIQQAVDVALAGDQILVTNGIYTTGGRATYDFVTNRVAVTKPLTLQSVNGPQFTVIDGANSIRCVYLTNGVNLSGFTLTNGTAYEGAGIWCESASALVSNCVIAANLATYEGGGVYQGTLNNCTLTGNSAGEDGGGVYGGTLNNCTLRENSASSGGGADHSLLNNCALTSNSAPGVGGAVASTLNNCTLTGNSAYEGGGTGLSVLNNCTLTGNSAHVGGGSSVDTLNNCTLTGNWAADAGGGAYVSTLNNCIVYFNTAATGENYDTNSTLDHCCTTPQPANGTGNISADPQLASSSHLSIISPCRGAGSSNYTSGTDIDGEAWANPPSIGCDEYHAGAVTGPLSVSLVAAYTNIAIGYLAGFTALTEGRTARSVWDFGDGTVATNQPCPVHAWATPGDYAVMLRVFNESQPGGVNATLTVHVEEDLHYVAATSGNPVAPYSSWATAATNIQDAVDVAPPGATIFVTNGIYAVGGRTVNRIYVTPPTGYRAMANRVAVEKPLTVRSVNGPQFTVIQGGQVQGGGSGAFRCAYLASGASLSGFTLTNGYSVNDYGAGVLCESETTVVSNCVVSGNLADGGIGGGAYQGTLNNCTLNANSAYYGGGASAAMLNNCTLNVNSADNYGGGAAAGTLNNCTLTGNSASTGGGASVDDLENACTLNYCALTGNSAYGSGGGAFEVTLNNCALTGNSASSGGGAFEATLNNCVLSGNSATNSGGGAISGTLNNCTLTGNSAYTGGGVAGWWDEMLWRNCTLNNCIVYFNTAPLGENYDGHSTLNYCCTLPLPTYGVVNITNAPLFVDQTAWNLRLQSNSPCINAGNNAYAPPGADLDGNPRIVSGTVDIGVFEFQNPTSVISYAWLQGYGLPTDGSADYTDTDGDGLNNWQEWRTGTDPTSPSSVLKILVPAVTNNLPGLVISWQSVAGINYFLQSSTNLPFFTSIATNITGQAGTTTYTDTNSVGSGRYFYRVGVQ
jgi:hypothetical protein